MLRAAVGDCIKVHFSNQIAGKRVGMHVDGVAKDVNTSDGAHIGENPDTTVPPGGDITYTWFAQREGQFPDQRLRQRHQLRGRPSPPLTRPATACTAA